MNTVRIDEEMTPRTQRFTRELAGSRLETDPVVLYWRRASAVVWVAAVACLVTVLAVAGAYAPPAGDSPATSTQAAAAPADVR